MNRHVRRLLRLERLFGADFLPAGKAAASAVPRPRPEREPPRPPSAVRAEATAIPPPEPEPPEWVAFRQQVLGCTKCDELCARRTQVVFGVGSVRAPVVFIGEAPGEDEDRQGEPFVGRAGQLLTRSLAKLGVSRAQVYIANVLKCRPPGNRTPQHQEMGNCMPYLLRQIGLIRPKILCVLGNVAAQALLNTSRGITQLRGRYHDFQGTKVFAAYHPAYVLRNMSELTTFETDMRRVLGDAGLVGN